MQLGQCLQPLKAAPGGARHAARSRKKLLAVTFSLLHLVLPAAHFAVGSRRAFVGGTRGDFGSPQLGDRSLQTMYRRASKEDIRDWSLREKSGSLRAIGEVHAQQPALLDFVPSLVTSLKKASRLEPHELSDCLVAAAKLQEVAPEIQYLVPSLLEQLQMTRMA